MSKVPSGFTGPARDLARMQSVADPKITVGHLRVLQRVDGFFVLFDKSLPVGAVVDGGKLFPTLADAKARAVELVGPDVRTSSTRPYDGDIEAFAGMARALRNDFAKHEPAYSREELLAQALEDGCRRT